jgi:Protein of unknown function (DUF3568)
MACKLAEVVCMLRKMMFWALSFMMMMNLTGCFLLVAGVAGGAGTAIWLSGKLTQEFHYPYQQTIEATKLALKSLNLEVVKETREEKVAQIKSTYSDGKEMWIDINKVTDNSTRVEVRVGSVNSDKEAASAVLKKIQEYL